MARLRKCRRVCCMPAILRFTPDCQQAEYLALSVDEIESLRLCDLEGLEQDEAAAAMEVSRGTFQRILYSAHKKTAEALCEGKGITIGGGDYELAEHGCSGAARCSRCRFRLQDNKNNTQGDVENE